MSSKNEIKTKQSQTSKIGENVAAHEENDMWSTLRIGGDPSDGTDALSPSYSAEQSGAETPIILDIDYTQTDQTGDDEGNASHNRCVKCSVRDVPDNPKLVEAVAGRRRNNAFVEQGLQHWSFGAFTKRASKRSSSTDFTWRLKNSVQHGEEERLHFRCPGDSRGFEVCRDDSNLNDTSSHTTQYDTSLLEIKQRLMANKKRLPSLVINAIAFQITRAIAHAHGLGVCHLNINTANVMVQGFSSQLSGWGCAPSVTPFSAPEIILSSKIEHWNADTWSIGMVIVTCLRGLQLFTMRRDMQHQDAPGLLATLFRMLGTPQSSALLALDPTMAGVENIRLKKIKPQSWAKLLNNRSVELACAQLLDRMLDWNPATRESASSLLNCHYFRISTEKNCKYIAATMCNLTPTEVVCLAKVENLVSNGGFRGVKMLPLLSQRHRTGTAACFKRLETIFEATQFE